MRISGAGKSAIVIALLIAPIALSPVANADISAQGTPAPDPFKAQMDQYRADRENYINAMKQRNLQMKVINTAFKNSCDIAASDFRIAMSNAKNPDAKNAAITARKSAITSAIAARDSAIALLGAEPIAPTEPVRSIKPFKTKNR